MSEMSGYGICASRGLCIFWHLWTELGNAEAKFLFRKCNDYEPRIALDRLGALVMLNVINVMQDNIARTFQRFDEIREFDVADMTAAIEHH